MAQIFPKPIVTKKPKNDIASSIHKIITMRKLLLILFLCNYGSLSAQVFLSVDSFNYFDNAKWQKNTNGFDGIGCNFTNQNVTISDSSLKIIIDQNSDTTKNKQFLLIIGVL